VTLGLLSFVLLVAGLLIILYWSLRRPADDTFPETVQTTGAEPLLRHAVYFSQVRQSFSDDDFHFLASRGSGKLASRVRGERRRVALEYLRALQEDFRNLMRVARVLAALSPAVVAQQESERFWLAVHFECRYQMTRAILIARGFPLGHLHRMTQMIGTLGARLEAAMVGLSEQAARAVDLASTVNRGGGDLS